MADPVKRLHYFDKQFLREQDFIDEQNYQIQRQRDHNQLLHTPGIAQGLEIPDPPAGSTRVTVNAGIAYDNQGREIVLANNQEINLESLANNQSVYLAIAYAEQETDPTSEAGVTGNTRWTEEPLIETLLPDIRNQFPADPEEKIILAKVNRSGKEISTIERTERRAAGVVGGDLEVRSLTLTNPAVVSDQWSSLNLSEPQHVDMEGSLRVNGNLNVTGTIEGKLADGSVGTNELGNVSVTLDKLATNSVNAAKIVDLSVGTNELANGSVTLNKLATNSVNAAKIVDLSVGTNELANGSVNADKLANLMQVQGEGFQRFLYTITNSLASADRPSPTAYGIQNDAGASTDAAGSEDAPTIANSQGLLSNSQASSTASEHSNALSYGVFSNAIASTAAAGTQQRSTTAYSYGVTGAADASTDAERSNAYSYGVYGIASATSEHSNALSCGVYGRAASSQERSQSYGVYGFANAGESYANSPVYGVYGYSHVHATEINSPVYGVYGYAYASQAGSKAYGVYASVLNGISLYVNGNATITGNLDSSHITDRFINGSAQRLRTGDVVKLKGTPIARFQGKNNKVPVPEVTLADRENDSKVIGIVDSEAIPGPEVPDTRVEADDPTFIEDGGDLYVVILGNYAHCKVDATEAPIEVGDLLTSSNNPGHAKKATDPKLGSIIGKALEPLQEGTGYIAVFVNIQ